MSASSELLAAGIRQFCWEHAGSPADVPVESVRFLFSVDSGGDYGYGGEWVDSEPTVTLYYGLGEDDNIFAHSAVYADTLDEIINRLF